MPLTPGPEGLQSNVILTGEPIVINDVGRRSKACKQKYVADPDGTTLALVGEN